MTGASSRIETILGRRSKINGQSVLEYAVVIGVVAAALAAMSVYIQRSIQANLKVTQDQINLEQKRNLLPAPPAPEPGPAPEPEPPPRGPLL